MLVWGTRAVKREIASGSFDCSTCRSPQPYRHVRAQRHGHAYGIPLLPRGEAVEYVECQGCRGTFDARILVAEHEQRARIGAADQRGMLHVMVATLLADGQRPDSDTEMIMGIFEGLTGRPLSHAELEEAIHAVESREDDLPRYLEELEPHLNDVGKERVVHAALFAAASDAHLDERVARQVKKVAHALGMSAVQLEGIVAGMPNRVAVERRTAGRRAIRPVLRWFRTPA